MGDGLRRLVSQEVVEEVRPAFLRRWPTVFVDVSDVLSPDGIRTSAELAQALLDQSRVAVTPGEAFDAPGFLRLSYATSLAELRRGVDRIISFVRSVDHRPREVAGA